MTKQDEYVIRIINGHECHFHSNDSSIENKIIKLKCILPEKPKEKFQKNNIEKFIYENKK